MTNGARGSHRERMVMRALQADGWVCYRSAGSHGCADLVALKLGETPRLVQVKASQQGAFEHFGPAARQELLAEARQAGAEAWLCWWPAHRKAQWIPSQLWPVPREIAEKMHRLIEASGGDVAHAVRVAEVTMK